LDLCEQAPPEARFDFVYLNGIVHHLSSPARGLANCARAVSVGGRIWVYFYRSGTFKWFVCDMIRRIVSASELNASFLSSANIYALGETRNLYSSRIMDDFLAPFIHLYALKTYIEFMNRLGFELCGSQDLDPLSEVNHDRLHHSASLVFVRVAPTKDEQETGDLLQPASEVDQLDPELYSDDERAIRAIDAFRKFEAVAKENRRDMAVWSTLLGMHKVAAGQYYEGKELPPSHDDLIRILDNGRCALGDA